ncbi:MAG TPA: hypothetical protein VGF14_08155 [Alphaproteobacteria bacterium]
MPSKNPRVNMTFEADLLGILTQLATRENKTVAGLAKELVFEALELREDIALSQLAALRDKPQKTHKHDDVWK